MMRFTTILIALMLAGCATTQNAARSNYSDLYTGQSQAAFATEIPVASASEAIVRGDSAYRAGEIDQALYHYLQAVSKDDTSPVAFYRIGKVHQQRGDLQRAARAFRHALEKDRAHLGALEELGLVLLQGRQPEAARDYLERALIVDASRVRAHNGLGVIADLQGDHAAAARHYHRALELTPTDTRVLNNLGYSLYLSANWDASQRYFREVLRIDPQHELAIRNLALLEVRQGNTAIALGLLQRVMSTEAAHNDVGYLCMLDGQHVLAERYFNEAIALSASYYKLAQDNLVRNEELANEARGKLSRFFKDATASATDAAPQAARSDAIQLIPLEKDKSARQSTSADWDSQQTADLVAVSRTPTRKEPQTASRKKPSRFAQDHVTAATMRPLYHRQYVRANILNVRGDSAADAVVLDKIRRGRVVRVLKQSEDWVYVVYWRYQHGDAVPHEGWVHSSHLSEDPTGLI